MMTFIQSGIRGKLPYFLNLNFPGIWGGRFHDFGGNWDPTEKGVLVAMKFVQVYWRPENLRLEAGILGIWVILLMVQKSCRLTTWDVRNPLQIMG